MKIKKKLKPITNIRSLIFTPFTLVEVTMAIGVIAVGMVGIMALFPIGFQASKSAIADNYSSELVDQFMQVVAMQCKMYEDTNGDGTVDMYGWNNWINNKIPDKNNKPDMTNLSVTKNGEVMPGSGIGLYYGVTSTTDGVYYIEQKSGDIVDFSAAMALWWEEIDYDTDGDNLPDASIPSNKAVRLCVEISWPVAKPYEYREKRYYVRELFNQYE